MSLSKREYEEYKAAVDKMVYKYVARDRSSVVSAITHAIDSGCEKRKVEDKLMGYVDKSLAYKLAEKVIYTTSVGSCMTSYLVLYILYVISLQNTKNKEYTVYNRYGSYYS